MQKNVLEIGDKIELEHVRSLIGRTLSENKYASQLLDYDGALHVKISMPIFESRVVPLEIGDEFLLCFFTNNGLFQCRAKTTKRYLEKNIYILEMQFLTSVKKFQRRRYYRLDCLFPMKYRRLDEPEKKLLRLLEADKFADQAERQQCLEALSQIPEEWVEGTVSDISGGGIRFNGRTKWEPRDELEVYLPLSMGRGIVPVKLIARIIACVHYEESRVAYESRGEFIGVQDADREAIIKYVFEEQRRRLRKD